MSYDLHLLARQASRDLPSAARARLARGEEAIDPGPSSPEREAWKARLAAALRRANPRLAAFEFEYPALAARLGITEDEARTIPSSIASSRWRWIGRPCLNPTAAC